MENDKFVLYLDVMNVLNLFEEDRGIRRFKFSDQGVLEIDGFDSEGRYIITGIRDDDHTSTMMIHLTDGNLVFPTNSKFD